MNTSGVSDTRTARAGLALANWSQSWFPDPAVVAFLGIVVVFLVGVLAGEEPVRLAFEGSPNGALAALNLNTYNLIFIVAGLLLHWRPNRFLRAVAESIPATGGVVLQFPFYAMIPGLIAGTGLSEKLAHLFVSVTSHNTFAVVVGLYSAGLGVFIPSRGSKWLRTRDLVGNGMLQHLVLFPIVAPMK